MLCARLQPTLECRQSDEQFVFRPGKSIEDAFVILENIVGQSLKWGMPVWIVSLDLRKAFDTVNHEALFNALEEQGISREYIALLRFLYVGQTGEVKGSNPFHIDRGVKQGDICSSGLFNAATESAFRKWKRRLHHEGILMNDISERLTNIRYADDVLLFSKSKNELVKMLTFLIEEFRKIGLELNADKTKIISAFFEGIQSWEKMTIDVAEFKIKLLGFGSTIKYLGRKLSGWLPDRVQTEVKHRMQAAWAVYTKHRHILTNRHISMRLRFKVFDATISPVALTQSQR